MIVTINNGNNDDNINLNNENNDNNEMETNKNSNMIIIEKLEKLSDKLGWTVVNGSSSEQYLAETS